MAVQNKYINIHDNATASGPPVNVAQWGERAS